MMRSLILLVAILFPAAFVLSVAGSAATPPSPPLPSQWQPIADLKGETVREVAETAVKDYNAKLPKTESPVTLRSVVDGDVKDLGGGKSVYRFHLDTEGVGKEKAQLYEVVVGVAGGKVGEKIKQLLVFIPVLN